MKKNQSACFSIDIDISRNVIELAQEMAGLHADIASFAQMYNEADLKFKFKSWENLVGNSLIKEFIPNQIADECEQALSGAGLEVLINKISATILDKVSSGNPDGQQSILSSAYSKAVLCLQEVTNVSFVVNNCVFTCDVGIPNLIQQLKVPLPDNWKLEDESKFDPSFVPATYTAPSHIHELTLQTNMYGGMGFVCENCKEDDVLCLGYGYHCEICQYDLHPNCALEQ